MNASMSFHPEPRGEWDTFWTYSANMANSALTQRSTNEAALSPSAHSPIGLLAGSGSQAFVEKEASRAIMTPAV